MGLDMYLSKKTYVKNWAHKEDKHRVVVTTNDQTRLDIKPERVTFVEEEVMYWRKVNAVHAWFVENVQDGIDECQESRVTIEQLDELATICEKVVRDKNPELLPTQGGFFFGSTDYDDYYYEEIEETAKVLREEIRNNQEEYPEYFYQASW
tara:strand:+ start:6124 stop:6576 length:453 start_codon:yes stop_codon:yes gene_type:complete